MLAGAAPLAAQADLLVCPPATLIAASPPPCAASALAIGGQDCHAEASGAHTGDISAEMLEDAGASAVIVGHSERRADHRRDRRHGARQGGSGAGGPGSPPSSASARPQRRARGRPDARRRRRPARRLAAGRRDADNLVVAYEPVWAIGTGLTPTPADVARGHRFIRKRLDRAIWRGGRGGAHPLWRFGQALQCRGIDGGRQRQWRAGRRREPESRRFPCDRGVFTASRARGWKSRERSCKTAANSISASCAAWADEPGALVCDGR